MTDVMYCVEVTNLLLRFITTFSRRNYLDVSIGMTNLWKAE